ncbi:MAG: M20/M25/M40 family metallo-hydrolase [Clostridia bacterium]
MDLNVIKSKKDESAKYMVDEITNVIQKCGKRDPGSEGEKQAVEYMAKELEKYSDEVKIEPFDVHTASFFGWIYISVACMFLSMVTYLLRPIIGIAGPIIALVSVIIGIVVMFGQFLFYREMIDKMFKKRISHNLTAVKHPTGEVKRRIFFNGHPDAAYEWTFNYHLGGIGYILHVVSAFVSVVYVFGICLAAVICGIVGVSEATQNILQILGYCSLAFVPSLIGMFWMSNSKVIVDGANDNLTGCYMGIAVLKALKENNINLENTEVGVILSGSEEAGLRGAKAWCRAHKDDYKDCETLIFAFDTIHEGRFLTVNKRDLNMTVKADEKASALFKDSADQVGVKCAYGSVPLGATDSAAFKQGGFKATGITAMDHNLQDYYHTRRDTIGNLDEKGLADCFEASVQALQNYNNEK